MPNSFEERSVPIEICYRPSLWLLEHILKFSNAIFSARAPNVKKLGLEANTTMSVSRVNATSGTMASAAAIAQTEAVRYAYHFAELQNSIDIGDLGGARMALSEFQRDSAVATARGFDPVNQTSSMRSEFASIRRALLKGDITTAQASLSNLRKELGVPERAPSDGSALLGTLSGPVADENSNVARVSASGESKRMSSTFIKTQPALASFTQSPQVFPTSGASSFELSVPSVTTSTQAVLQGLSATQPDAQARDLDGTSFAPTPELMLGSKGMSIPDGAQLQFTEGPNSLGTVSFAG